MSDTPIRRSNWPSQPADDKGDPLAELERIVGRSGAPETTEPSPPSPSSQKKSDFLGINEDEFEAAFRALEQKSNQKSSPGSIGATSVSQSIPSPHRREPSWENDFTSDPLAGVSPHPIYKATAPTAQAPQDSRPAPASENPQTSREFEKRADIFDFDTHAAEDTPAIYDEVDLDNADTDPEPAYFLDGKPRSGLITIIAVTGLVFIAVIGALAYSWMDAGDDGEAVTIKADNSPVKTSPAAEPAQSSSGGKLIYDRLGSAAEEAGNEQIVSREEQPVENLPPANNGNASRVVLPNPASGESRNALTNPRPVTTTTIRVRPDGTLETVPANAAATASPAPAQSQTPGTAGAGTSSNEEVQDFVASNSSVTPVPSEPQRSVTPPEPSSPASENESASISETSSAPVTRQPPSATEATNTQTQTRQTTRQIRSPEPAESPLRSGSEERVASAPATQIQAGSSSAAQSGGFVVQLSSQRSEAQAQASFASIQGRFPQVLANYRPSIKPVDLGARGTYYRVRIGPLSSRDEASALCAQLKSAGGDCVVTAN